ncbi:hypothetical protein [Amycolatopsis sp. CA-230715]|uniref:hypothetical protein n=1 Tax=Amycolatopsis sp. CA-230715 TaxID=2745196 RepID=UPI001C0350E2|nr:hypothetical protein [Amycolatopsis sp. CA-230715]QWF86088.1 hypothetical protein HUW46_09569 [Amycolatopsis sp. CA-230715]
MLTNVVIDQSRTFAGLVFLSCAPKMKFGSKTEQDRTKDGVPKWEVEVLGATYTPFGGTANEVVKVGINAVSDPCEGIPAFSPIELGSFSFGVLEKKRKDRDTGVEQIVGISVFFRADEVKLAGQAPTAAKAA